MKKWLGIICLLLFTCIVQVSAMSIESKENVCSGEQISFEMLGNDLSILLVDSKSRCYKEASKIYLDNLQVVDKVKDLKTLVYKKDNLILIHVKYKGVQKILYIPEHIEKDNIFKRTELNGVR